MSTTTGSARAARAGHEAAIRERQEVNEELKRAHRLIDAVAWLYRLGALAYVIATLLAVLALTHTDVPSRGGVIVVGVTTLLSVLMLMGAIHILFKPFIWTLVIALLATVVSVVHFFGPNPYGLAMYASAAWAAVAWAALMPTLRFRRLIASHKDNYILLHASAHTRRSLKHRTALQRHARLLGAKHRAARRAWRVSFWLAGTLVLASTLGTWTVLEKLRPELLSEALARFEAAWNTGDLDEVGELFDARVRKQAMRKLGGVLDGHGLRASLPPVSEGMPRAAANEAGAEEGTWVDYGLGDLALATNWVRDGTNLTLVRIELPVPPLDPVFERFEAAWNASNPSAIASFFSEKSRERMRKSIESSSKRRGWNPFPSVLEKRTNDFSDGDGVVKFTILDGEVTTEWLLRPDGTWGLVALRLP